MSRRPPTILERLERQSRLTHPDLHLATRRAEPSPGRHLRRLDRALLALAWILAFMMMLRTEPGFAGEVDSWGLTLEAGGETVHRLALDTAVHAEVTGLLARVHVMQSFRNDEMDWMEGTYRFPLPEGAAVDRLTIKVGERILEGEIRARDAARRVYRQARDAGRTASLVTQERANQFATRLANIGPGETVHVMIGFLANVDYRDGSFRLRLPSTFTPRWGAEAQPGAGSPAPHPRLASLDPSRGQRLSLQVDLDAGLPLATIESLYHDVDIQFAGESFQVTLLDPETLADRDFELRWTPEFGAEPRSALSTWSDGGDVFAQLMLIPPRDTALDPREREVVFVIDTSGSMLGESMEQARAALHQGIAALTPKDRFNLVQFNSITEPLFDRAAPVTKANLGQARRWIDGLEADGGTDMAPALELALRVGENGARPVRQVVFITDGSVGNERQLLADIAARLGDSRLFTVGIGSAPNGWFMRKAAEIGRGHHTRIGDQGEVAATMADLWTHIRLPAISDLCVDWGQEAEYYPEVIPDLYAGQPLWLVARLPAAPDSVSLCGELNGQPWRHDAWPEAGTGAPTLATLWARRKIEALQDSAMFGADAEQVRAEATRVALDHGLLSPYTSLVAVDRTPARPAGARLTGTQVPGLLPAGTAGATGFPATATGWKTQAALSLLVLAVSGGLFLKPFFPPPRLGFLASVLRTRRPHRAPRAAGS